MGRRAAGLSIAAAIACVGTLRAQGPGVQVTVTVGLDGSAIVREKFNLPGETTRPVFRLLTRPCAATSGPGYAANFARARLGAAPRGPWRDLSVDSAITPPTEWWPAEFDISYVAYLTGPGRDVPLVVPTHAIPAASGERPVKLVVDLEQAPGAGVAFPRLERHSRNQWTAHLAAMPSFVQLAWPAGTSRPPCAQGTGEAPDDGGLSWRLVTFIGVMLSTVVVYLTWARRSRDDG